MRTIKTFLTDETAQDLVEVALLITFLALSAVTVLPELGKSVNAVFSRSASTLTRGTGS